MITTDDSVRDLQTPSPDLKPKLEHFAQVVWLLVLIGPLPVILLPAIVNLQRIDSPKVFIFGIMLWCVGGLAFVNMIFFRWDRVTRFPVTGSSRILFIAGIALYFVSIATWSTGIATLAWILHGGALLATHSGFHKMDERNLLAHWPALFVFSGLPEFVETKLTIAYQQLLFKIVASCFDVLRIPFRSENLTLEFAKTSLSVDEALTHSHSITWMLFANCLIFVWLRRPLALFPAYWCVALFSSFASHLVQLIVQGIAGQQYQLDLSTGSQSIVLTAATSVMAVGLLLSNDRCLQILFMPVPLGTSLRGPLNPITRGWNWLLLPLAVDHSVPGSLRQSR